MTEINIFDKSSSFINFDRDVEFTQLKGNTQHRAEVTREVQILSRCLFSSILRAYA